MKTLPVLCCGPATEPLYETASASLAARFRALSDPTRVAIINCLSATDEVCRARQASSRLAKAGSLSAKTLAASSAALIAPG